LGDFLSSPEGIGILDDSYYLNALKLLQGQYELILVFTNDVAKAKERVYPWKVSQNIEFLEENEVTNPVEDLQLLSECSAIITSNSTFSFWAAKLSSSPLVVYPRNFRKDGLSNISTVPGAWIAVDNQWLSNSKV